MDHIFGSGRKGWFVCEETENGSLHLKLATRYFAREPSHVQLQRSSVQPCCFLMQRNSYGCGVWPLVEGYLFSWLHLVDVDDFCHTLV